MMEFHDNTNPRAKMGFKKRVIAAFAFRYDAALVPDLIQNIAPFVDGWVSWDDRARSEIWYNEGEIRQSLRDRAIAEGADYIVGADPDERYERGVGDWLRQRIDEMEPSLFGFRLREMYSPTKYRVDGIWGKKLKFNVIPLLEGQQFLRHNVHTGWEPTERRYPRVLTEHNLYHLKMIDPANRAARRDLYTHLDTTKIQKIGYDYLVDDTEAEFEEIAEGRSFDPAYDTNYVISQLGGRSVPGQAP